jgi:hypothetical protein
MSAHDNGVGNTGDNLRPAGEQTDRAAEESNEAGSYSPERHPEDPEAATPPLDSGRASEPSRNDQNFSQSDGQQRDWRLTTNPR